MLPSSRMTHETPYLHVVDMPRMMGGAGAPRSTVFGVLGRTGMDPMTKSLGGLVGNTKASGPVPPTMSGKKVKTERKITGTPSKTHIPGEHYGQVPYVGKYMSDLGSRL